ncbi:MAG: acylphosphatase [Proteobacteria bacterium]|nr:acylphosphatase [Pseudomonadota bacterium]
MKRAHILVSGIVQCVFFRYNTMREAHALHLKGWVRNGRDGRVECVCEGNEDNVDKMVKWCKRGPQGAYVENVDVTWEDYTGEFKTFQILY